MGRSEQAENKTKGGWLLAFSLDAPDERTVSRAFLFSASMLLLAITSAPIASAILQEGGWVCQQLFLQVRK